MRQHADYRRLDHLGGLELLKATYTTHSFAPHAHGHFVIGLVTRGVETYRYQGERVVALPGQLILVNPGEVHTGEAGVPEGWSYQTLYPSVSLVEQAVGHLFGGHSPYFRETVVTDGATAQQLKRFHQSAWEGTALEQESQLLELLTQLFTRHGDVRAKPAPSGREHRGAARARAYLDAHFQQDVSLSRLASIANLSPYYLNRIFKAEVGLSPHAYQMTLRMQRAKTLLTSNQQVAQVAAELGFFDQSHFAGRFKRFVGVTPLQYKKSAV